VKDEEEEGEEKMEEDNIDMGNEKNEISQLTKKSGIQKKKKNGKKVGKKKSKKGTKVK